MSVLCILILLSIKMKFSIRGYFTYFFILFVFQIITIFSAFTDYSTFIMMIVVALVFSKSQGIKASINNSVTVTFIVWIIVFIVGVPFMVITPDFHFSFIYHLIVLPLIPFGCFIIAINRNKTIHLFPAGKGAGLAIFAQLLLLLIFNFGFPIIFSLFQLDTRQIGILMLYFLGFLIPMSVLFYQMGRLSSKNREMELQTRQAEEYCRAAQDKYVYVIKLRHYYSELFKTLQTYINKNNMPELKRYFEENISTIYDRELCDKESIEKIENELLRNLIEVISGKIAEEMRHIKFYLQIHGKVIIPDKYSHLIFEMTNILIENAINNLSLQDSGLLQVSIVSNNNGISIKIINSLFKDIDVKSLSETVPNGEHGYGLARIREITLLNQNIEHYTMKNSTTDGGMLLTQQIILIAEK